MSKFTNKQTEKIKGHLEKKNVFEVLNKHLAKFDLGDFEVEKIQIRPKAAISGGCGPGYVEIQVIDENGRIVKKCVKKPK